MSIASASITPPEANAAEQSRMELQARLNGLGGLNGRKLDPEAKAKKLREACEGFESIFIQKMWQEMRNTVPKSGLLTGRDEKIWQDMYDQELSKSMTKAGGIGLADMMYEQLSRGLADASSSAAAGSASLGAFVPAAAPLIMAAEEQPLSEPSPVRTMAAASIYEPAAPQAAEAADKPKIKEQVAPVMQPVERKQNLRHADTHTVQPGSREKVASVNSGIQQAYMAKREAGDKLSSHGIRPAMNGSKNRQQAQQTEQPVQAAQTFAPGSAQALEAAINLAKNGAAFQPTMQPGSINDMVNAAKTRNTLQAAQQSQGAQTAATVAEAATADQPTIRRTTFTTNIPQPKNAKKKNSDAIRMLNVDKQSVNSKQGNGIAAYHAQQQAMAQSQQPNGITAEQTQAAAAQQAQFVNSQNPLHPTQPAAPIAPLTAAQASDSLASEASFAIPPLKAGI